jgi:SAM-dependent methyltransferase
VHGSSLENMKRFVDKYLDHWEDITVLDVGSQDVNGTYKPLFKGWNYKGLDVCPGNNVDIVVQDSYHWSEVESRSYDVVISGQAFEHIEFPWLTMGEIARVLKPGGFCCIIAPSSGPIHWEKDCWRFLPYGLAALAKWAKLEVLESYIGWESIKNAEDDQWKDAVLICRRRPYIPGIVGI